MCFKGIQMNERNRMQCFATYLSFGIIDVGDQQLGYYKRTGDTERKLKLRGRVADELAKSFGFTGGYRVISLVEMDFAQDEQEFINQALFGENKETKKKAVTTFKI